MVIAQQIGEADLEIQARNDLAHALRNTGQLDQALTQHRSALSMTETTRDRYEQARAHDGIGELRRRAGDLAGAYRHWRVALRH